MPEDVRAGLVASLFGTLPIYVGGVINTIMVALLIAIRIPEPQFIAWLIFEIAVSLVRLSVLICAHRAAASGRNTHTDIYLLLGLLWSFSVGYGCFVSLWSGDWVASTLACLSAAAMVGGMCFRNFAAPRFASLMILLSLGPCMVAAPFTAEPVVLMVMLQIPLYLFSMTLAAFRLNAMMVSTMTAEREYHHLARHDHLTGLLNRAGLMQEMAFRLYSANGTADRWTLFYMDLDGFKQINDRYGHASGDVLLEQVAERLKAFALPDAALGRIGGDEFVILCAISDRSAALLTAERLMLEISSAEYEIGGGVARVGASVGIALHPDHGRDVEALLHAADVALYCAKSEGGHRCRIADNGNEWATDERPMTPPVARRWGKADMPWQAAEKAGQRPPPRKRGTRG